MIAQRTFALQLLSILCPSFFIIMVFMMLKNFIYRGESAVFPGAMRGDFFSALAKNEVILHPVVRQKSPRMVFSRVTLRGLWQARRPRREITKDAPKLTKTAPAAS